MNVLRSRLAVEQAARNARQSRRDQATTGNLSFELADITGNVATCKVAGLFPDWQEALKWLAAALSRIRGFLISSPHKYGPVVDDGIERFFEKNSRGAVAVLHCADSIRNAGKRG
jgi:hypothetical protein